MLLPVVGNKITPPGINDLFLIVRECIGLLIYVAKIYRGMGI